MATRTTPNINVYLREEAKSMEERAKQTGVHPHRYGAPMGRYSASPQNQIASVIEDHADLEGNYTDTEVDSTLYVQAVTLDSGGYDASGAYWGLRSQGKRLYAVFFDVREPRFVEATSRTEAFLQWIEDCGETINLVSKPSFKFSGKFLVPGGAGIPTLTFKVHNLDPMPVFNCFELMDAITITA